MKSYNLKTERFLLKEIEQDDITYIYQGLSHPEVIKYYGVSFHSLEDTRMQMEWYADLRKNHTGIWFGIYSLETLEFCGAGGFNNLEKQHHKAEIGFWLLPEFWKKGIMNEVMPELMTFGFEHLNLNRIEAFVESENLSCKKAIEKCNFILEGRMRECEVKNGKYIDVDTYAALKPK
ncbi:GNAT family N-acetyltransferase [Salegentibacter chungangensis]|uniref:GNAT family N-acetyltransferase n=1 Tax=Salegentibacter chungangensis TaxID=1335724 RepID=A0ABW3NUF1_9FLAO